MTCPDAECHSNLQDLKDCTKMLKNKNINIQLDIEKKVSRKELWFILLSGLTLSVPIFFTSAVKNVDWKLEREAKSAMNKLAIEVMAKETQKDIANINEKICDIRKQQEQLPNIVYNVVKEAMEDARVK